MENAQKAIMIAVGLFITIIIITAVMLIMGLGTNLLNEGQNELSQLSTTLTQSLTASYDNVPMTGAQVLSAVQQYYNDVDMIVAVNNVLATPGAPANFVFGTSTQCTITDTSGNNILADTRTDAVAQNLGLFTSSDAINQRIVTTGRYTSKLIMINGAVAGIGFYRTA